MQPVEFLATSGDIKQCFWCINISRTQMWTNMQMHKCCWCSLFNPSTLPLYNIIFHCGLYCYAGDVP